MSGRGSSRGGKPQEEQGKVAISSKQGRGALSPPTPAPAFIVHACQALGLRDVEALRRARMSRDVGTSKGEQSEETPCDGDDKPTV